MVATALLAAAAVLGGTTLVAAYRTGPPAGHTGAFGEPDCGECHFDAARNEAGGGLEIGAPESYRPGESYDITVSVRHPELRAGGFQLSARFTGDDRCGQQAGSLTAAGPRVQVVESEAGVAYASHSEAGAAAAEPGVARWTVRWTAPAGGGTVVFDAAGNAANDDMSEFGDRLYTGRSVVRADAGGEGGTPGAAASAAGACGSGAGVVEKQAAATDPRKSVTRARPSGIPGGTPRTAGGGPPRRGGSR